MDPFRIAIVFWKQQVGAPNPRLTNYNFEKRLVSSFVFHHLASFDFWNSTCSLIKTALSVKRSLS